MSSLQVYENGELLPPGRGGARRNAGRKPGPESTKRAPYVEKLPRVLSVADEIGQWRKALKLAEEKGDAKTMALILQNIHENRRGRPFVSSDPRARREPANDRSLIVAIQNMLPNVAPKPESRKKRK